MTTYIPAKKNTEYIFYIGLVSQSTGQFQSNPTLAAGDFKVSKDGGALANLATLPAVTPASSKSVKVTLSSTEMDADNVVIIGSDAAGAEWDDVIVNIQTAARQIDDLSTLDAAGVRSAVGLAGANLDTQLDALPTAAENADAVWDEDATGHQTQGTFGQAIGDPVADTNTIYKAVVTDATGATVGVDVVAVKAETASIQTDTNDIQNRLPAALSGDGFMKADLKSIEDDLTSGNNATLRLKRLSVLNNTGDAVNIESSASGGIGIALIGDDTGLYVTANQGTAIYAAAGIGTNANALTLLGDGTGKSINAPQDIALPSGDLDDQLQAIDNFVDTEVAAIKAKTDQLTFTTANQVDTNVQSINDKAVTGDGSAGNPWGPAP